MTKKPHPEARTFYVDTRFEKLARRPGGVSRDQAIASAQAEVDDLKTEFIEWLDQELGNLGAAFARIESSQNDTSSIDGAHFSCAHLRDVGTTMGFELVTFIANNLCEILDAIKAGAAYDKDVIDCHLDAFRLARMDQYRHLRPDQVPEMTNGLRRVVELASIIPDPEQK
jgi:chemotaxis protein histidine kinase CheA